MRLRFRSDSRAILTYSAALGANRIGMDRTFTSEALDRLLDVSCVARDNPTTNDRDGVLLAGSNDVRGENDLDRKEGEEFLAGDDRSVNGEHRVDAGLEIAAVLNVKGVEGCDLPLVDFLVNVEWPRLLHLPAKYTGCPANGYVKGLLGQSLRPGVGRGDDRYSVARSSSDRRSDHGRLRVQVQRGRQARVLHEH